MTYASFRSTQNATRSVSSSHSLVYRNTDSMHFLMKGSTPYSSMAALPWMRSSFSTSTSTGSPCVSQPALRGTV